MKQGVIGLAIYLILMIPPVIRGLESNMITHMLVQIPLLIFSGWLMTRFLQIKFPYIFQTWNKNGIPGIILFIIMTTYWMIPRMMDETLALQSIEVFKFISLPFLTGVTLRDSWGKLSAIGKNFVVLNYIPMFAFMAWLYIDSPIQICNNYLEAEQKQLGWGFLIIMAGMLLYMIQAAFTDQSNYES